MSALTLAPAAPDTATDPAPTVRPGAIVYMPAGLTDVETIVYRHAHNLACKRWIKANGSTAVAHDGPAPAAGTAARRLLARRLREASDAAHAVMLPYAHTAGMRALVKHWGTTGETDRAAAYAPAPAPRKRATRKPAADVAPVPVVSDPAAGVIVLTVDAAGCREIPAPDPTPAPVPVVESDTDRARAIGETLAGELVNTAPGTTWPAIRAARKSARRDLAARLRTAGLHPAGTVWTVAVDAARIGGAR